MENESLGKLSHAHIEQVGWARSKSWSFIRKRIIYSREFSTKAGKRFSYLRRARTWQSLKNSAIVTRWQQCITFLLTCSSSRDLATTGTQCRHYDARKTNLGKFPRCVRCLTSRLTSGTKLRKRLNSPIPINPSVSPINFSTIFIRIYMGKKTCTTR